MGAHCDVTICPLIMNISGQPRRHLLQSGWSVFVSSKRLVAGDAFIFLRLVSVCTSCWRFCVFILNGLYHTGEKTVNYVLEWDARWGNRQMFHLLSFLATVCI